MGAERKENGSKYQKKRREEKEQERKEQLRQTAHSDWSSLPKIRLTCKQLTLNYNKELIL